MYYYGAWLRRLFLHKAGLGLLALVNGRFAFADSPGGSKAPPGLIIRDKEPENLEFPFSSLDGFTTRENSPGLSPGLNATAPCRPWSYGDRPGQRDAFRDGAAQRI
jgi:hypothetical protein